MAISKLKLLEIEFPIEKVDVILSKLIHSDDFHPEPASKFADSVKDVEVLASNNPYHELITKVDDLCAKYDFKLVDAACDVEMDVDAAFKFYEEFSQYIESIGTIKVKLETMIQENKHTMKDISYMRGSGVNFDELFTTKYLQVRYGKIPVNNLRKLDYYEDQRLLYQIFYEDNEHAYMLYVTSHDNAPEVDNIFSSLFFERIKVPTFVHGNYEEAIEQLTAQNTLAEKYVQELEEKIQEHVKNNVNELSVVYETSKNLDAVTEAKKYVVVFGKSAAVYGFSDQKHAKEMKKEFEQMPRVHVEMTPPQGDYRLSPPTRLKLNWFSNPFTMFVKMYGIPAYTDMDPTNFVAITYCLLFGMMFADLGQGIVLILVGLLVSKLKGIQLGEIAVRVGIFSSIFGFIFGSVFGSEDILVPFFTPMDADNTMTLLGTAVAIGAVLIVISIIFNTYMNAKKKNWPEFFLSQNGISGLVFYISILFIAVNSLLNLGVPMNKFVNMILIICPILLMFLREPLTRKVKGYPMFPDGFGSFFVEAFFDVFDVVLTFLTNTMSFLRVGGFVLSHAGMMLVVYTIANMAGGIGYWITLVLGNIFVMGLEGLIVGIQVLRLEFYEMFSRYYEGNGRPFISMKQRLYR